MPELKRKTLDGSREVEFVLERDGGPIPVEVRAQNGATISLKEDNASALHGDVFVGR